MWRGISHCGAACARIAARRIMSSSGCALLCARLARHARALMLGVIMPHKRALARSTNHLEVIRNGSMEAARGGADDAVSPAAIIV